MHLQKTYIKDKFLASATLYRHGASKFVQEYYIVFLLEVDNFYCILCVQGRGIVFLIKWVEVTYELLLAKL